MSKSKISKQNVNFLIDELRIATESLDRQIESKNELSNQIYQLKNDLFDSKQELTEVQEILDESIKQKDIYLNEYGNGINNLTKRIEELQKDLNDSRAETRKFQDLSIKNIDLAAQVSNELEVCRNNFKIYRETMDQTIATNVELIQKIKDLELQLKNSTPNIIQTVDLNSISRLREEEKKNQELEKRILLLEERKFVCSCRQKYGDVIPAKEQGLTVEECLVQSLGLWQDKG